MTPGGRSRAARGLASLAATGVAVLWAVLAFRSPQGPLKDVGPPFWVAWAVFTSLALAVVGAAVRRAPLVMLVAAVISLVPVGLYVLMIPGVTRWIGVLDLVVAASAAWAWREARREDP